MDADSLLSCGRSLSHENSTLSLMSKSALGSLPHKCRSSDRLHRLVCDRVVWLHLLKQTAVFSKEKLKELVSFVRENRRSELMPEVLRAAASKFPPSDPRRKRSTVRIIWTVQGWGAPETMDMEGYVGHGENNFTCSNVKELTNVA